MHWDSESVYLLISVGYANRLIAARVPPDDRGMGSRQCPMDFMLGHGHEEFDNHELVAFCCDAGTGLLAIIAIHDTSAGPAAGGCRIMRYATFADALADVLRLSKGMTYKAIMAGLPLGGGKAVILADPRKEKTPELLMAFAERVAWLGGTFITGEDVGTTVADIEVMRRVTPHVRGIPANGPGDPSPMTALGVLKGIEAAVKYQLRAHDLKGIRVIVQDWEPWDGGSQSFSATPALSLSLRTSTLNARKKREYSSMLQSYRPTTVLPRRLMFTPLVHSEGY